ncbi:MAG: discoidin domain-containing protein [Magnetococcales bacterium]|nr:discoidin domain-containing protein [Magnetococcales bacterium]
MAAHRFWRLYITKATHLDRNILQIQALEFRATLGGASICTGGSAFASAAHESHPASLAFDGDDETYWGAWLGDSEPVWIGYDLGPGRASEVEEIALLTANPDSAPSTFSLQHSDDGALWTTLKQWTALQSYYYPGLEKTLFSIHWMLDAAAAVATPYDFNHTDAGPHRYWRLFITKTNLGIVPYSRWWSGEMNSASAQEIAFRATLDGPSICTGGAAFGGPEPEEFWKAFDNNPATGWIAVDFNDGAAPVWIGYNLGYGHASKVSEIAYMPGLDTRSAPNSFSLQYSDDGELWHIFKDWRDLPVEEWVPFQPKIFATGPIQYASAQLTTAYPLGGDVSTAHRFWRLYITGSTRAGVNDIALAGIEFRASLGGASICIDGEATASHNPENAASAFDAWMWDGWEATVYGGDIWIGYDLGDGITSEVAEIQLTPLAAGFAPSNFALQWSDDGTLWGEAKSWSGLKATDWEDASPRLFRMDDAAPSGSSLKTAYHFGMVGAPTHRHWRLFITESVSDFGNSILLTRLELRSTQGGSSICVGGTATASRNQEYASQAFDDQFGEDYESDWFAEEETAPLWIAYDLGEDHAAEVVEIRIVTRDPYGAPRSFSLQYSDDGVDWWVAGSWENLQYEDWPWAGEPYESLVERTFQLQPLLLMMPVTGTALNSRYGIFTGAALVQLQSYGAGRGLATPFQVMQTASCALSAVYGHAVDAGNELATPFQILAYNAASAAMETPYRLLDAYSYAILPPLDFYLLYGARRIEVVSAEIGLAEGDYAWSGSATLAELADFQSLGLDDAVTLMLGETAFALMVDSRSVTRGADSSNLSITLVSATATLAAPRADLVSMVVDETITASEAAASAVGPIVWEMVDWPITPGRIAFHDAAPMAIAEAIAGAAGGVIETLPDGSLCARPRFPVRVPDWPTAEPDHVLTEDNILSIQESYWHIKRVNRVVVRDWQPTPSSGRLSIEPDNRPRGLNRGSPYLRPGGRVHLLVHASPDVRDVTLRASVGELQPGEPQEWQESVDLVFVEKTTVTLPAQVTSLDSWRWLGADLGDLTLESDGITVRAAQAGLSVARVLVTRRAFSWLFTAPSILAGDRQFPIAFIAIATDGDSVAAGEITALRGDGLYPGDDVLEPLASHVDARRERGRAVIDAGEPLQEVSVSMLFDAAILPGQLIEVNDAAMGMPWRGKAKSVRHYVGEFPTTSIDLVRHVAA